MLAISRSRRTNAIDARKFRTPFLLQFLSKVAGFGEKWSKNGLRRELAQV